LGIVGHQLDANRVVHVEPLRVMIHAFRDERRLRHEAERLHEVAKLKLSVELAVLDRPPGAAFRIQRRELCVYFFAFQRFACHVCLPLIRHAQNTAARRRRLTCRPHMPLHAIAAILAASVCTMPSNVLPVLVGLLADAHGLNEAQIGYLVSTNMAAGLLASTTAPYWIVRVNPKYAVGACLALDACGLLGLSLAPNLPLLFVAQIVIGGATVGVSSICVTVLAQLPNPARALGIKITSDVIVAGTFLALAPVDRLGLTGFVGVLAVLFLLAIATATPRLPARAIERTPAHLGM